MSEEYSRYDELTNEPVLDHNYDGIEELDNPLPGWWLATFYITIVYAAGYFFYHNIINDGESIAREFDRDMKVVNTRLAEEAQKMEANLDDKVVLQHMKNAAALEDGKGVFTSKCASCHGPDGGGGIGPNLTDAYWLNGKGEPVQILKLIRDGVMSKGMPAWGAMLSNDELEHTSAYVLSLKGSTPTNPKPPQGEKVE